MEVIKAKSAGFCFGVKKAMETVYQQIEKGEGKRIFHTTNIPTRQKQKEQME